MNSELPGLSSTSSSSADSSLLQRIQLGENRPSPSLVNAIAGVIRYELVHSVTIGRLMIWMSLVFFPVALVTASLQIMSINMSNNADVNLKLSLSFLMFLLLPQSVTVLSMLLYAAPIVNAELESQAWVYAVVRPKARKGILLGKYLVAVLWCGTGTSLASVLIAMVAKFYQIPQAEDVIAIQLALCWLAAFSYGALFLAIGTFFQRRAMVYAFAYSVLVEAVMGWIPAVVNLFTISYRLRSLLFSWFSSQDSKWMKEIPFQWEDQPWKNIAILTIILVTLLGASIWRVDRSQYRWQSEV